MSILEHLPKSYLTDYTKWLSVTSVLKCHGKHDIWSEWSKQGSNYDEAENERHWNNNKGILDINYLVWVLNQSGQNFEQVPKYKAYSPVSNVPAGWVQVAGDAPFVSDLLTLESFRAHDTILIESCTGTGKTTAVAKHMDPNSKCLSIVTRTSLADQHCKSFEALGLRNYQDVQFGLCDEPRLVVCLNSLAKLEALDDDEIKQYTVFVDEVSSLIEFTSNDLLDSVMKKVVVTLTRLLRLAGKVILCDAMLRDGL